MYELYSEILYKILHIAGNSEGKDERDALLYHLQKVFNMDNDKHILLLEKIREREAPTIFLNIEVIEARNLNPTDPNGLSDPFCSLYLKSTPSQHFNTSVKPETLYPVWEENFSLPVKNLAKDVLCLEVWDFDPQESTREKMKRIKEVKSIKGIKLFMKEVASANRHNNDLVGSVQLPLKNIPATGQTVWCSLDKNGKLKKQGDVKVHLSFGFEKNSKAAFQEHKHLLYVMLLHELRISKEESVKWNGKFSGPAETILSQHLVQCGLTPETVTLAQWVEFINVHILHPLNFNVFLKILRKLVKNVQDGLFTAEEEKLFWDGTKNLLATCMANIKKLQIEALENNSFDDTSAILSILSLMASLHPPRGIDLFPFTMYEWLSLKDVDITSNIQSAVIETVQQGSKDWFTYITEKHKVNESFEEEDKLNRLITVVDLTTTCLKRGHETHDKIFQEHFHFPYAKKIYESYDSMISKLVEPIITSSSDSMKPVKFNDSMEENSCDSHTLSTGASLFQLYLSLQKFSEFGKSLISDDSVYHIPHNFHHWFYPAALQWIYISYYKALHGIKKAVHLDQFIPHDESVQHSSSAIDTLQIFDQIRIFWKRLSWPDNEAAFSFATNIINDICDCCFFYAEKVSDKVERICENSSSPEKRFEVNKEWCIAVRNISHIQQSIKKTIAEFGLEDVVTSLVNDGKCSAAETCRNTICTMVDDGVNTLNKKIKEMLERASDKMKPTINKLLVEAVNSEGNSLDQLMKYLDDSLCVLNTHLSSDHFKSILEVTWKNVSSIFNNIVEVNIKSNREPSFYKKQHDILKTLADYFKQVDLDIVESNSVLLNKMENILLLRGMETSDLIHQYYLERRREQKCMETPTYGLLTVRMQFAESILRIEIMNARNLVPLNNKGSCNPYVKVYLLPEEEFSGISKLVTKSHKKVVFPLFEEKFSIELSPQQVNIKDGLVMFVVKDKYLLGMDKFLGEAFASFTDIIKTDLNAKLESMEQLHLKLNRPTNLVSEAFGFLRRREEKVAQDFIKKRKHMYSNKEDVKD